MAEIEKDEKVGLALAGIKNRILVFSGKGGVGKSTVAANLAMALSLRGCKVGALDVDFHGPNLAKMLGAEGRRIEVTADGILPIKINDRLGLVSMSFFLDNPDQPVIWRGPMKAMAMKQMLGEVVWGDLDWLIIDSPPGTGDEPLSVAQLIPATGAIVVTTPQDVAILDSRKAVGFARKLNLKVLGIIENMSGLACPHCGRMIELFKTGGGEKAAADLGVPFLGRIPIEPAIVDAGDGGRPITGTAGNSEAAAAFARIIEAVLSGSGNCGTKGKTK